LAGKKATNRFAETAVRFESQKSSPDLTAMKLNVRRKARKTFCPKECANRRLHQSRNQNTWSIDFGAE